MRQDVGCSEQEFERDVREIEDALRTLVLPEDIWAREPVSRASHFPWASVAVTATVVSAAMLGGLAAV